MIDAATLTGAGRVALGTDVPAVFVNDEVVRSGLWIVGIGFSSSHVCVCARVCVCERETEQKRAEESGRERERESARERGKERRH